jgi:hypothetical protein
MSSTWLLTDFMQSLTESATENARLGPTEPRLHAGAFTGGLTLTFIGRYPGSGARAHNPQAGITAMTNHLKVSAFMS